MQEGAHSAYVLELTNHERGLVHALAAGEIADLGGQTIRASVLRDLALGRRPGFPLSPAGLRISDAIVEGCLDLSDTTPGTPVILDKVEIRPGDGGDALRMDGCSLPRLILRKCLIGGAIRAAHVDVQRDLSIENSDVSGAFHMPHARVGGALSIVASMVGDGDVALHATGLAAAGRASCDGTVFRGRCVLTDARFPMGVAAPDVKIIGPAAVLAFDGAHSDGDLILERAVVDGDIRLAHARIGGRLAASGIVVTAVGGGIDAAGLHVRGGVEFDRAMIKGRLEVGGMRVRSGFTAHRINVDGGDVAVSAAGARIEGDCVLASARLVGRLELSNAAVTGDLRLPAAKVFGSDRAVRAVGLDVGGKSDFSRVMLVGGLCLQRARFGGDFLLRDATIRVEQEYAVDGTAARFAADVGFNGGFQTIGAIILDRAQIEGTCDFAGAHLKSSAIARGTPPRSLSSGDKGRPVAVLAAPSRDEQVLSFAGARITHLKMPESAGQRPKGICDFTDATVEVLDDCAAIWPPPCRQRAHASDGREIDHFVLTGFRYRRLGNPSGGTTKPLQGGTAARRITWLLSQRQDLIGPNFHPQPWEHLAQCLSASGLERDAERVRLELYRRQRKAQGAARPAARLVGALIDWITQYGRAPLRPLVLMLLLVIVSAGVFSWAASQCRDAGCADQSAFRHTSAGSVSRSADPKNVAADFPAFVFALDRVIPVFRFTPAMPWQVDPGWAPLAEYRVPDIPVFLGGETEKSKLYTTLAVTGGMLLYAYELTAGALGTILTLLFGASFAHSFSRRFASRKHNQK
jgi:hypothetical protein